MVFIHTWWGRVLRDLGLIRLSIIPAYGEPIGHREVTISKHFFYYSVDIVLYKPITCDLDLAAIQPMSTY